jgi:hypothetical protein
MRIVYREDRRREEFRIYRGDFLVLSFGERIWSRIIFLPDTRKFSRPRLTSDSCWVRPLRSGVPAFKSSPRYCEPLLKQWASANKIRPQAEFSFAEARGGLTLTGSVPCLDFSYALESLEKCSNRLQILSANSPRVCCLV